jgi:hypothetical protein
MRWLSTETTLRPPSHSRRASTRTPVLKRLGDVAPSDKVGPLTGRQYEYQHEQTTMGALEMLAQHDRHCVYCEWHDDFVVEVNPDISLRYHFHQVKSKSLSQGPWSFHELFGVSAPRARRKGARPTTNNAKPKAIVVGEDAILHRLLTHDGAFGMACGGLMFVTNAGIDPIAQKLLDGVASASSLSDLATDARDLFDHLVRGYCTGLPPRVPSPDALFGFLKRFAVASEQGSLRADAALNDICDRVFEYSEIDLKTYERKQIARQLVQLIRAKATDTSVRLPVDEATLRSKKGIVVAEVLAVLSLSHEGFLALKQAGAGKDLVRTLSRLERFCRTSGLEQFTSQICAFKAKWDVWRTKYRHQLADADHMTVLSKAREILAATKTPADVVRLAKEAAEALTPTLPGGIRLAGDEMVGLVFSLAADAEPK